MILNLESTTKVVTLNGIPARVWEGFTNSGIRVICFIPRVAVQDGQPAEVYVEFEKELRECVPPSAEVQAFPLRMIL